MANDASLLSSSHHPLPLPTHSSWVGDMVAVLQADELPQDVAGAEALLTSHSEHKAEIDARQDSFTSFKKNAEALIAARHYASQEVVEYLF